MVNLVLLIDYCPQTYFANDLWQELPELVNL